MDSINTELNHSQPSGLGVYPAPWQLTGTGYILAYHFPRDFVQKQGLLPPALAGAFAGGPGAVMLVNYETSAAGPYRELLFVPGRFRSRGRRFFSISKIYVSTWESVVNGRRNWGIPKEKAKFDFEKLAGGQERVTVAQEGHIFAEFIFRAGGPRLHVSTRVFRTGLRTLIEPWNGRNYFTTPNGHGRIQPCRLVKASLDAAFFPDVSSFTPLACIKAGGFHLEFPPALIQEGNHEN